MSDSDLTLQLAAEALGVHYMTAYRYVRLGQLTAEKQGGEWRVRREALDAFREQQRSDRPARLRAAPWTERLQARLLAGDAVGAWQVVEAALAAGSNASDIYLGVLAPALRAIGDQWERGEIDISVEHRASGIALRMIGRLGPRFARRGRTLGGVVVGSAAGERHSIVTAILADLLRIEGWEVSDLGADTPGESFVHAAGADGVVAVGVSVTTVAGLVGCAEACAAVREAHPDVMVFVGGQAMVDEAHARLLGAHHYAPDAATMMRVLGQRGRADVTGAD